MVIILGLSIFPAVWAFILSLQKWNGFAPPKFVGGNNYGKLLSDEEFWAAVSHTGLYVVLFVPASVLLGLFLAVALNRDIALIGLYRTAIFVPFVASAAATGILSTYLFSPQFGLANNVLRSLGLPAQHWLEDPNQAMLVIAIMSLWGQAAFTTVIYLAALQDVPTDLLEAARIHKVKRIVWFSSIMAYGERADLSPVPEDTPLQPTTIYGATKAAGEALLRAYRAEHGVDGVLIPPADPRTLGWWSDGALPGAVRGGALVTGHTVHTGGGQLDDLEQVRRGDQVRVRTDKGVIGYRVTQVRIYRKATLARDAQEVFSQTGPGRLVLVTCEDWDGSRYLSNVVVLADPQQAV